MTMAEWCDLSGMKLNASKTKTMIVVVVVVVVVVLVVGKTFRPISSN